MGDGYPAIPVAEIEEERVGGSKGQLRHEGDVLGTRQSGIRSSLRLLSVVRDEDVIADARDAASAVLASDPELAAHPALAAAVERLEDTDQADYLERT